MKVFLSILMCVFLLSACSTQVFVEKEELHQMIENKQFEFIAKKAYPSTNDIQRVIGNFPNASSSRMLELDYGYFLSLKDNQLEVDLPYFGRAFRSHYGMKDGGYKFTSQKFDIQFVEGKRKQKHLIINPKDISGVSQLSLQIFENGSAYLVINSTERLPISYNGYLTKSDK